jgi:hypothetical protein
MGVGRSILAVIVSIAIMSLFVVTPRDASHTRASGAVIELRHTA